MSARADLRKGWALPGDSVAIEFSEHAIERFAERVRPSLDPDAVRLELCRLLATTRVTNTPPEWYLGDDRRVERAHAAFLTIGDDLVMPLAQDQRTGELVATTALVRDMTEGRHRHNLNATRGKAREAKRHRRRHDKHDAPRRPPAPPSADEFDLEGEE